MYSYCLVCSLVAYTCVTLTYSILYHVMPSLSLYIYIHRLIYIMYIYIYGIISLSLYIYIYIGIYIGRRRRPPRGSCTRTTPSPGSSRTWPSRRPRSGTTAGTYIMHIYIYIYTHTHTHTYIHYTLSYNILYINN